MIVLQIFIRDGWGRLDYLATCNVCDKSNVIKEICRDYHCTIDNLEIKTVNSEPAYEEDNYVPWGF